LQEALNQKQKPSSKRWLFYFKKGGMVFSSTLTEHYLAAAKMQVNPAASARAAARFIFSASEKA
jgi:cell division protein YceG involved in septum cleavage